MAALGLITAVGTAEHITGSVFRAARQAHCKHRTFAWLARHGHVATHHARELAGDGKSQPRSAVAACGQGIGLGEMHRRRDHPPKR